VFTGGDSTILSRALRAWLAFSWIRNFKHRCCIARLAVFIGYIIVIGTVTCGSSKLIVKLNYICYIKLSVVGWFVMGFCQKIVDNN